jgi:putative component of toxin-antitoxin plasmid stabilization module
MTFDEYMEAKEREVQRKLQLKIDKQVAALRREAKIREALCKIQHGHQFGDNRVCKCGLSEKRYHMWRLDLRSLELCPLFGEHECIMCE